ncbi:MAG: hypothetical protein IKB07_06615 [Lachnospiraceae bacterium]|nr:hypothetical protein [Lachnospiraceae bacterium]
MRKQQPVHYYVEGEDEKSFLEALKRNLEDELRNACDIKAIGEVTKSKTKADFKRDIIRCSNLGERLKACGFDVSKLWSRLPENAFKQFGNDAHKIKK